MKIWGLLLVQITTDDDDDDGCWWMWGGGAEFGDEWRQQCVPCGERAEDWRGADKMNAADTT